jgi:hypothetical protein
MAASSGGASIPSQDDGHKAVTGMGRGTRMQATDLRTGQPAFSRGLVGALLAVVVAAALIVLLIVGTITRSPVGPAVTDVAFDAAARGQIEFRALEPAAYAAMLKEAQERAFIQFRADEHAVLTPDQAAANQREAVRKFHITERTEKFSSANGQGAGANRGK